MLVTVWWVETKLLGGKVLRALGICDSFLELILYLIVFNVFLCVNFYNGVETPHLSNKYLANKAHSDSEKTFILV